MPKFKCDILDDFQTLCNKLNSMFAINDKWEKFKEQKLTLGTFLTLKTFKKPFQSFPILTIILKYFGRENSNSIFRKPSYCLTKKKILKNIFSAKNSNWNSFGKKVWISVILNLRSPFLFYGAFHFFLLSKKDGKSR